MAISIYRSNLTAAKSDETATVGQGGCYRRIGVAPIDLWVSLRYPSESGACAWKEIEKPPEVVGAH
jgi:hypothetical protein